MALTPQRFRDNKATRGNNGHHPYKTMTEKTKFSNTPLPSDLKVTKHRTTIKKNFLIAGLSEY